MKKEDYESREKNKPEPVQSSAVERIVSKPKLHWCFECGGKLMGNHHKLLRSKEDGHTRQFHKGCAEKLLKHIRPKWETC